MADVEKDQVFVEYVVKALVDNPEKVVITRSVDDRGVLLELSVDPSDMGKIIGKGGATAKSLRTLLRVLGAKDEERYNLKIAEPEGSEHNTKEASSPDTSVNKDGDDTVETEEQEDDTKDTEDSRVADIKAKAREGIEDLDTDI